ncbi:hypothetical protein [Geobacter sp. FeAm09]|uniref:hypothetical protein n=1 Tax=Geobacter sp. FeAm09 TaxID=2597769 RepID=UPI00143DB70E|nr:hypothetical protein [Geobacter sp. FeAm09]
MTITELIEKLEEARAKLGDVRVCHNPDEIECVDIVNTDPVAECPPHVYLI